MNTINYIKSSLRLYFDKKVDSYKYIDKKVSWVEGFFTFLVLSLISYLSSYLVENLYGFNQFVLGNYLTYIVFFAFMIFLPILILVSYFILHLIFRMFGGQADFKDTLKFGVSTNIFPSLVFMFLGIVPAFLFEGFMNVVFVGLFLLISLLLMVWSLLVTARVYSKVHKISFAKSIIALLIPLIAVIVLPLILLVIIMFLSFL